MTEETNIYLQVIKHNEATLAHADKYRHSLMAAIDRGERKILIDLTDVDIIDSTFLGVLVVTLKKLNALGGDLKLFGLKNEIILMFELTRLSNVFKIYKSKEEAISSFYGS